jgi:hypothetical protein
MLSGLLLIGDVEAVIPMCPCLIWVLFKFCEKEQTEIAIMCHCTNWSHFFNFQLDAQNYLFIYNTFIKILYMFRAVRCSFSGGLCG